MALEVGHHLVLLLSLPVLLLDLITYALTFAWIRKLVPRGPYSIAVGSATSTHGAPRRSANSPDELIESGVEDGKVRTVYGMVQSAIRTYGDKAALVSRKFVELKKLKKTDRFPTKIYDDTSFNELSYTELGEAILNFGAGLRVVGMEPIPQLKEGAKFDDAKGEFVMVIFEDTCSQWTVGLQGAFSQSITVATCYATLGEDAVVTAVNETAASCILLNWKNAEKFAKLAKEGKMPTLKTIIASTHEMPEGTPTPLPPRGSKVTIVTTDELTQKGEASRDKYAPVEPKPSDVAVIMFTSGSTGKPKGVVMTHSQLVSGVSGMAMNVTLRSGRERYVSYLPLAHILALQIENALLNCGSRICYADPRTMAQALPMFKPTLFAGVPKVYEMLRAALEKKLRRGPKAARLTFEALLAWKTSMLRIGLDCPVTNLFFGLISKKVFGGILEYGVSGGGPMSESLSYFCRACFCCPIIQGYALTETCVGGTFQNTSDARVGVVGGPVPCVEIMLQSEPEITDANGSPYLHTDTKGGKGEAVIGRGEICMRGPCISSGYYKMPEKTREEYDAEGFFHTGDIGQFTADGVIQIVDRKKNLIKLKGGEYVAVEAMENAFVSSPFASFVCVVANGDLDGPLAIVRTDNEFLRKWAAENNVALSEDNQVGTSDERTPLSGITLKELAAREETRKAAVQSMIQVGKEAGLTSLELRMKDCVLVTDVEWGPGNGFTATMKIDRKQICKMHAKELDEMLKRNGY